MLATKHTWYEWASRVSDVDSSHRNFCACDRHQTSLVLQAQIKELTDELNLTKCVPTVSAGAGLDLIVSVWFLGSNCSK